MKISAIDLFRGSLAVCPCRANRIGRYDVKNPAIRAGHLRQRVVRDRLAGTDVTDTVTNQLDAFNLGDELNHRLAVTHKGQHGRARGQA